MQQELQMQMLGLWFAWDVGQIIIYLSTPTVRSWWILWVVMAACHCYSWWGWWFDALWAILIRLWLYSLSCHLQGVVLEFFPVLYITSVSTRLARYWPSYSYILAETIVCSWAVIDDLKEKLWMQATVAYYLMLDNHHRMSSGYLRAEFDERKVSRKWPCEIREL